MLHVMLKKNILKDFPQYLHWKTHESYCETTFGYKNANIYNHCRGQLDNVLLLIYNL